MNFKLNDKVNILVNGKKRAETTVIKITPTGLIKTDYDKSFYYQDGSKKDGRSGYCSYVYSIELI